MMHNTTDALCLNISGNTSIFGATTPPNFNPITDTITTEGQIVIFTHHWTVEEIIKALAPVWIILYILLSITVFYFTSRYHNEK